MALLVELLLSFAWVSAMFMGMAALIVVRLSISILTPLMNALIRNVQEARRRGHVFRGEGNDQL